MRDYLKEQNLRQATLIAVVVTVMALPRLVLAGVDLRVYLPAGLLSMILVAAAATAWGHYGGLHGMFPERRRMIAGMAMAVVLAWIGLPLALRLDALRLELLAAGEIDHWRVQPVPTDPTAIMALLLWSAGFETMFFQAGALSYLARLLKRRRPALAGAVILRGFVSYLQMGGDLSADAALIFQTGVMIDATLAGGLYVAAGWPAAATYTIVLGLRHFWT